MSSGRDEMMSKWSEEYKASQEKKKDRKYYYTPEEWSRSIGYGVVPDERNSELKDKNVPTRD